MGLKQIFGFYDNYPKPPEFTPSNIKAIKEWLKGLGLSKSQIKSILDTIEYEIQKSTVESSLGK